MLNVATCLHTGAALLVATATLSVTRPLLQRWRVLDLPNHRSSHVAPVVRGAGIALGTAVLVMAIFHAYYGPRGDSTAVLVSCLFAAILASFVGAVEDLKGLSAKLRLVCQLAIGTIFSFALVELTNAAWWWVPLGGLAVACYTNVANFMDGVDGISALHGIALGSSFAVYGLGLESDWLLTAGLLIASVFCAFLPWNLLGAKMFLGDAGSYLLGAAVAAVAFAALLSGLNPVSVVGPLVIYVADVGVTLIRRVRAGENWLEAHRNHVYQRLTDSGMPHFLVAFIVFFFTLSCAMAGLLAIEGELVATALAVSSLVTIALLYLMVPSLVTWVLRRKEPKAVIVPGESS